MTQDGQNGLLIGCSDGTVWRTSIASDDVALPSKKKTTFVTTNHTSHVSAIAHVAPNRVVSADLTGALCLWNKGSDDALAHREAKTNRSGSYKFGIDAIAVIQDHLVVRESSRGFLVLEIGTLKTVKKLPHKGASVALTDGKALVTTGGKLLQSWCPDTWEQIQRRSKLSATTVGVAWVDAAAHPEGTTRFSSSWDQGVCRSAEDEACWDGCRPGSEAAWAADVHPRDRRLRMGWSGLVIGSGGGGSSLLTRGLRFCRYDSPSMTRS